MLKLKNNVFLDFYLEENSLQTFPNEHPVLLTEAPLNPMKHKEKTAEIFFESLNAPALYIQMQAVLALYSTGMKFLGLFWSLLKRVTN